jgi:hypothetical protein
LAVVFFVILLTAFVVGVVVVVSTDYGRADPPALAVAPGVSRTA